MYLPAPTTEPQRIPRWTSLPEFPFRKSSFTKIMALELLTSKYIIFNTYTLNIIVSYILVTTIKNMADKSQALTVYIVIESVCRG
jgi:hypothetical protein